MDAVLTRTVILLIVAILVAIIARRLHLPYTVGLVLVGMGLTFAPVKGGIALTHEFIFDVILPPLLFEAALNIHWGELRRDLFPVFILASVGVVIAAFFVTCSVTIFLRWPWASSLIFGILIAATDPVAVIAMFKECGITGRIRLLVESESLFNDGVAAVLFALAVSWAENKSAISMTPLLVMKAVGVSAAGGILMGAFWGVIAVLIAGRVADNVVEAAITTVVAYGSFLFAENVHVSGVLAVVTAGLIMGNSSALSQTGRGFILDFWEFIAFIANSLIFLLIGLRIATMPFETVGLVAIIMVIAFAVLGRALAVYTLCLIFAWSRWKLALWQQHILWWGGLRGALALALALYLPESLTQHSAIVIATFAVVAFSVVVQGLTTPLLLKQMKGNSLQ